MSDFKTENGIELQPESSKRNPVLLIGIGIFSWIAIGSFGFLFLNVLKDIFFHYSVEPKYTEIFSELTELVVMVIGIIFLVNYIQKSKFSEWKIFKFAVIMVVIGNILQYAQQEINDKIRAENYIENSSQYYDFMRENPEFYLVRVVSWVLLIIISFFIIYLKKNKSG